MEQITTSARAATRRGNRRRAVMPRALAIAPEPPRKTDAPLHRLENLGRGHLRGEQLAPVGVARQNALGGLQRVVARTGAPRRPACLHGLDRTQEQAPGLDDGLVRRAEVLLAAIDDGAHALL